MFSKSFQIISHNKPLLLLWITLTSTAPFIFYSWPGHPYKILTFICLLVMIVQIGMKSNSCIFDFKILSVLLLQIFYYIFISIYHFDFSNINLCIQLISLYIIVTYINGFIGFEKFVKSYIYIIYYMGLGGTIIFFVHLFVGVSPLFEVQYSASGKSYFLWLTTSNLYLNELDFRIVRYSGFFDEPGTFALFSFFAIILNKIYFKQKKMEIKLILLTIFTLSIAFYISIFIYFMFFYLSKSNIKSVLVIFLLLSVASYYIIENKDESSMSKLYEFTFKRFEIDDSGLAENNRAPLIENDKKIFYKYPLLGSGTVKESISGANLFSVLAQYGVFGALFYYAFLIYFAFQIILLNNKKSFFYAKFLVLIFLNFYTRPEMSSVFTLLTFICIIYNVRNSVPDYTLNTA